LASDAIVFLINSQEQLVGSLTDGDIRRGLIRGLGLEDKLSDYAHSNPRAFARYNYSFAQMQEWREKNFQIIPVVDKERRIVDIVNFRTQRSYLPVDAVIMAGGKGTRLRPLTEHTPKPLLKIGNKPIVEYNVDRLKLYGIWNQTFTIRYLGDQIKAHFGDGQDREVRFHYFEEEEPLGTIGALGLIDSFVHEYVLVMNSDLLTNIDYEDMFRSLLVNNADMVVATTPYDVKVPYGVVEVDGEHITELREKPTYTYYSNAGIYILKRSCLDLIPRGQNFDAPDLMQQLIEKGKKVVHFPILGYWLDIGKPRDFEKAQQDITHIQF
jgi:NDP-sugar pyrophosphorylase family protein